jgi:hypothetical protein
MTWIIKTSKIPLVNAIEVTFKPFKPNGITCAEILNEIKTNSNR